MSIPASQSCRDRISRAAFCVLMAFLVLLPLGAQATAETPKCRGRAVSGLNVGFPIPKQVRPEVNRQSHKDIITGNLPVRFTVGGTATLGIDYELRVSPTGVGWDNARPITTAAGVKTVPCAMTVYFWYRSFDDGIAEEDETVLITLLDDTKTPPRYFVPDVPHFPRTLTLVFANDDPGPALSIADAGVVEGGDVTFSVTLSMAPTGTDTVTVDWATSSESDDSAVAGTDYTAASGTLTFQAGETGKSVTVRTTADAVREADETFTVTLSNPSIGILLGDAVARGTIKTDEPLPVVAIAAASQATVTEGSKASFTLTATPTPAAQLTVSVTVGQSGDFATAGATGVRSVTIPLSGSAQLDIDMENDDPDEPDGAVTATVGTGQGYTVASASSATATVSDNDDTPPVVSIAGGSEITEGGTASFTLTATPAPSRARGRPGCGR